VPIYSKPQDILFCDVFVDLQKILGRRIFLKCEGLNTAGSAKLLAARSMIEGAERSGRLGPNSVVIESSSGNLGVALAMVCTDRGHDFICVLDPLVSETNWRLIEALGGKTIMVDKTDKNGGYLTTRIELVMRLCQENSQYVWLDQYTNKDNWRAHHELTAVAIDKQFPELDYLFVGAGTCGTLMGCARYFREHSRRTRIVAVDSVGSVTFGGAPGRRWLPGLGTSRRPAIADFTLIDDVVMVEEAQAVRTCRRLAKCGYLLGASTGSVISGAMRFLDSVPESAICVAISPDMGERYLNTVYNDDWLRAHGLMPEEILDVPHAEFHRAAR
jgi:N-(2-amino-2-carboxyethyl)-L-glutamate synthase